MKVLKKHKGNTNTDSGFNFNYTCYQTLREDWAFQKRGREYDRLYVSESGNKAETLKELKKNEG